MKEAHYIDEYADYLRAVKTRADNTIRACVSDTTLFSKFISCEQWADVTEEMAAGYVKHLQDARASDTTIERKIIVIKMFFKFLCRKKLLTENPFQEIEFKKFFKPVPNPLTVGEMNQLLSCIREPLSELMGLPSQNIYLTARDKGMIELMYACGLRVSETCGLNWDDLAWRSRELRVFGKGNKERIVPVGQFALDAMLIFAKHYEERFHRKAEGANACFISHYNRRLNQRSLPRTLKKWARKAGIARRVNAHALRHSAAQHLLDNGMDISAVQVFLGHSNVQTTQIYATVSHRKLKSVYSITHPRA